MTSFDRITPGYKRHLKISGLATTAKAYEAMTFGDRSKIDRAISEFKTRAKAVWLSQKRKSHAASWKQFMELYRPTEYWCEALDNAPHSRDDVYEVWYTTAE